MRYILCPRCKVGMIEGKRQTISHEYAAGISKCDGLSFINVVPHPILKNVNRCIGGWSCICGATWKSADELVNELEKTEIKYFDDGKEEED